MTKTDQFQQTANTIAAEYQKAATPYLKAFARLQKAVNAGKEKFYFPAAIEKNLYGAAIIDLQRLFTLKLWDAFAANFKCDNMTSDNKRARIIRVILLDNGVNLDFYGGIILPGTQHRRAICIGKYVGNGNKRTIEPATIKSQISMTLEDCKKTCLTPAEIKSKAEVITTAYKMVKAQQDAYIDSVRKLFDLAAEVGISDEIKRSMKVEYW